MNDADFAAQKARVEAMFALWIPRLRLQGHRYLYIWERGCGDDTPTGQVIFECDSDWRYLSARITCYLEGCADQTDERLAGLVVHELVHVHLSEIRLDDDTGGFRAHEERVTECLARAFLDTFAAGKEVA